MCYEQFLPCSWTKVTIMYVISNAKPFRNSPYFPAHIHIKDSKVARSCVWRITRILLSSGHCFSEDLESLQFPSLLTEAALNDVAGLNSGLSFLYLCHSSGGQHGKWQKPSALRNAAYAPLQQCELQMWACQTHSFLSTVFSCNV